MTYKNLLVHLDDTAAGQNRMDVAIALAASQQASVTGIALALESTVAPYVGSHFPANLANEHRAIVEKNAESALHSFQEKIEQQDIDWQAELIHCNVSYAPAEFAYRARHTDISVLGQPNPDTDAYAFQTSLVDGVLFDSGRPVYIVPYVNYSRPAVQKTVVAWDGGKKAVRALNDAIPLLQGRGETIVLMVNPKTDDIGTDQARNAKPGEQVIAHLKRHGIEAKLEIQTSRELSTDALILNLLADTGSDLIVMGAYGHSRLREKVFGSVTENIIRQMTAPVVMSA